MQLTAPLNIVKKPSYFYRLWGYWKSPGMLKILGHWSDRQDQRLRTLLMTQRGKGKSRADSIYEKLSKPKYRVKWVRAEDAAKQ
jgi:hypothetical protein